MNRFVCWFVKITGFLPAMLIFRTKIAYLDKKVQKRKLKGNTLLVSNHTSVWDFALWMYVFWKNHLHCLAAEMLFERGPFMNRFVKAMGGIRIDRGKFDFSFITRAADLLKEGGILEVYPEGRLPLAGERCPLPFSPSFAYIALLSGASILPVYTDGNYFCLRRTKVIIGTPIDPSALTDASLSEKENIERVKTAVENTVASLGKILKETPERGKKSV